MLVCIVCRVVCSVVCVVWCVSCYVCTVVCVSEQSSVCATEHWRAQAQPANLAAAPAASVPAAAAAAAAEVAPEMHPQIGMFRQQVCVRVCAHARARARQDQGGRVCVCERESERVTEAKGTSVSE